MTTNLKDISLIITTAVIFAGVVYGYATLNAKVDEIERSTGDISSDLERLELTVRKMELRQAASGSVAGKR